MGRLGRHAGYFVSLDGNREETGMRLDTHYRETTKRLWKDLQETWGDKMETGWTLKGDWENTGEKHGG